MPRPAASNGYGGGGAGTGDDLYDLPPEWLKNGGASNDSLVEGCYDERTMEGRETEYDLNTLPDAKDTGDLDSEMAAAGQPAAETRRPGGGIRRGGGGVVAPKADEEAFKLTEEYHPVGHGSNDDKVRQACGRAPRTHVPHARTHSRPLNGSCYTTVVFGR